MPFGSRVDAVLADIVVRSAGRSNDTSCLVSKARCGNESMTKARCQRRRVESQRVRGRERWSQSAPGRLKGMKETARRGLRRAAERRKKMVEMWVCFVWSWVEGWRRRRGSWERDRCVEKQGVGVASCSFQCLPKELSAQARGSLKVSPGR